MFILLLVCFFCPFLKVGNFAFPISYLTIAYIGFLGLIKMARNKKSRVFLWFFILYFIYTSVSCLTHVFISNSLDLRGVLGATIAFFGLGSSYYLANKLNKFKLDKVLRLFNYPLLVNNIIVFLSFYNSTFKDFFYSVVAVNPRMLDYPVARYSGLGYDGFSYSSTLNALFFLVIYFFLSTFNSNITKKTKLLSSINLVITIICTILIGRTGVAVLMFGLIMFFLFDFIFYSAYRKIYFLSNTTLIIAIFSIVGTIIFYTLIVNLSFYDNFVYGFKVYSEFIETGQINDGSVDDLADSQYFLPSGTISTIFGTGNFGRGANYVRSDVGFVLATSGYGLFGILLFVLSVISIFYLCVKNLNNLRIQLKLGLIVLILLFINFKDYYIFYPIGHFILIFTFMFYLRSKLIDNNYAK